jgi:hypothetical protein
MSIRNRVIGAAVLVAMAHGVGAQNLIENSAFDVDIASWTPSAFSTWSNKENHGGSDSGDASGSLQVSTSSYDSAFQCVAVTPGEAYSLQAWIEEDPIPNVDPCSSPGWNIQITWFDDSLCQGNGFLNLQKINKNPIPLGWNLTTIDAYAPDFPQGRQVANSVKISLGATCGPQHGTSIFYFDDVSFTLDRVFKDDFEGQAAN